MSTHAIDAVSLSIMWDRLVGITDEIVSALIRSSFSTIVRESGDLSVVVLDAQGNSMAQGSYSVPSFTGTAAATLRHMLAKFPPDWLEPGDVIATNDAWMGTGHLFDINVMRAGVPKRPDRRLYVEHHPPAGHRRPRVRRRRDGDLSRRTAPSHLQAGARGTARRADVRRHPQQRAGARAGLRRPHGQHHVQRGRGAPAPRVHGRVRTGRPRAALGRHPRPERAGHPGPHRGPPRRHLRGHPRHRGHRRRASPRLPRRGRRRGHQPRLRRHLGARPSGHQRAVLLHARHGLLRRQVPHRAGHGPTTKGRWPPSGSAHRKTRS